MTPGIILIVIAVYFLLLIALARWSAPTDDNSTFFTGHRKSPWYVVAFGMVGASLSGVSFISVPGWVRADSFAYMQVVLGYVLGYQVIIRVLLPLYYRMNLTSIYEYLRDRFGPTSYRAGASLFLLSRFVGASLRLYLVAMILHFTVFSMWDFPFWTTVAITVGLIWVYTFRGGIKTIVWTDTLQTLFMLGAVGFAFFYLAQSVVPSGGLMSFLADRPETQIFFFDDFKSPRFFWKQFLSGAFITIVMTGLDQDMMQKNLTCRSLRDAQRNMFWLSVTLVAVNLLFLGLGAMLYAYAEVNQIAFSRPDELFAAVALSSDMSWALGLFFILGLIAAAYSSADSALASLTTSFCVDIADISSMEEARAVRFRKQVHLAFSVLLVFAIVWFERFSDQSVIEKLFVLAGYTYGPLLGLYGFGLFTKRRVMDRWVWIPVILAPVLAYVLVMWVRMEWGYVMRFEHLILNGALTASGLYFLSKKI
jgi:SSS family solute:Na+ symporter